MRRQEPSGARRDLGREGLAFLKGFLGGPPAGWTLERSSFTLQSLRFSLVNGPRRLELSGSPQLRAKAAGGGLGLCLRSLHQDLSEPERALVDALAAAAAKASFSELIARLGQDALLYCDPDGNRLASRLDFYRHNDHSNAFWKFVYPQWRCLEEKVSLGERWARINYATLECRLSNPSPVVPSLRYFADEPADRGEEGCRNVETPITEADVLGGRTQALLGQVLDDTAGGKDKPAYIHLNTTCLPELIGDTPAPFIRRIESELGVPVFWTSKTRPGGPLYSALIGRLLDAAEFAPRRDPRAVLLAGVGSAAARAEAETLCAALGLRVVGAVFPNLDFSRAPEMRSAGAVVWLDPVGWETVHDGPFLRHQLAVVRHHPPYGLAGTQAWLGRIASVLGLKGADEAWAKLLAERSGELESLRKECGKRTVALIGDAADIELLVVKRTAFGFSPAALLGELGFKVRCLVYGGAAAGAGTIEFAGFSSKAELDRALGRGVDLVFSHFNHDPRLHAHGLLGFTEAAFEPGLGGLLRAGRRLLAKCASRPFAGHRSALSGWRG